MNPRQARSRRARKTRAKLFELKTHRLTVYRSNCHIYAQLINAEGSQVLASASSMESAVRSEISNGGTVQAAVAVGRRIAEKAKSLGIERLAFDRSGYQYHGRVKALADAAREGGLVF
ncbi:MAG TPA: 50S ribosomal protein L18 [Betaproteobacteria bacterium]|nr:50S ribosomal protein L18 [Betaproteobacteria bacterium]